MNTNPYSTPQIENLQRATYSGDSQQPLHAPAARDLAFSGLQTGHLSGSINSENIDTRNMPYFGEGGSIQAQTGAPGTQIGASLLSGRKTGKSKIIYLYTISNRNSAAFLCNIE